MKYFTYTTQEKDYGLDIETTETLHVEGTGYLTVVSSNNSSEVKYSGKDPAGNTGALMEAIEFINNAKRNSKTLKVTSTVQSDSVTTMKGTINMQRFIW